MADLRDFAGDSESDGLAQAEQLGVLAKEEEATLREQRRFASQSNTAKLRQAAKITRRLKKAV